MLLLLFKQWSLLHIYLNCTHMLKYENLYWHVQEYRYTIIYVFLTLTSYVYNIDHS